MRSASSSARYQSSINDRARSTSSGATAPRRTIAPSRVNVSLSPAVRPMSGTESSEGSRGGSRVRGSHLGEHGRAPVEGAGDDPLAEFGGRVAGVAADDPELGHRRVVRGPRPGRAAVQHKPPNGFGVRGVGLVGGGEAVEVHVVRGKGEYHG